MKYKIKKREGRFTLHHSDSVLGEITVNVMSHDISGDIKGFGEIAFTPKGFLFWHYWEYVERGISKYRFRINNWRHLTLKDKHSNIEFDGKTVKIDDVAICTISTHVKNINFDRDLIAKIKRSPQKVYDEFADSPIYSFELSKKEYLPFVFASCVQEWVRSTL